MVDKKFWRVSKVESVESAQEWEDTLNELDEDGYVIHTLDVDRGLVIGHLDDEEVEAGSRDEEQEAPFGDESDFDRRTLEFAYNLNRMVQSASVLHYERHANQILKVIFRGCSFMQYQTSLKDLTVMKTRHREACQDSDCCLDQALDLGAKILKKYLEKHPAN